MKVEMVCARCKAVVLRESGHVNRSIKQGAPLYCDRTCAGLARRKLDKLTGDAARKAKSDYDRARRQMLGDVLKAKKAAAYQAWVARDPEYARAKQRERRAQIMPRHVEYCRRPEYKKWKSEYDREYRAKKQFGPFWESALLAHEIETEVLSRASRYEIDLAAGRLCKSTKRKREHAKAIGC